jgi:hypothetical protein
MVLHKQSKEARETEHEGEDGCLLQQHGQHTERVHRSVRPFNLKFHEKLIQL